VKLSAIFAKLWANPVILLVLANLFWAGNFIVGRAILTSTPPIGLAFWRWSLALIPVLLLASRQVDIRREFQLIKSQFWIVGVLAVLGISIFNTFVYLGLRQTTSVNALLLQSMMPLLILLVCFLLYREKPRLLQIAGVVISFAGVGFIATRGHLETMLGLSFNPGDLWVIAAVVAYAFYSALLRKKPKLHPFSFLAITFLIGALVLMPFYIRDELAGVHFTFTRQTALSLAYLVIFPSFLSYLFFNRGVELAGAARAGLSIHLLPVFGTVLAVLFLGESIEAFHLIGAGLIATGLLIAAFKKRS